MNKETYLKIFFDWAQLMLSKKESKEKMIFRGSIKEGWMDIDIENDKYMAGVLINSENIYDIGAVDKSNGKSYDKLEFFTTPEQLKTDLDDFSKHLYNNTINEFLTDISNK